MQIEIVEGSVAPRTNDPELWIDKVVITEQGTEGGLPVVDFVMTGPDGKKYFAMCTGRILNSISAAIKGVNLRNHGQEEP